MRRLACASLALLVACTSGTRALLSSAPTRTEHGWRTPYVVATRYANPVVGFNIGFAFPRNPNDCDRAELDDFMEAHGGGVYESGGYPGAEMFVIFSDVKNREDADRKLAEILPALDVLVRGL